MSGSSAAALVGSYGAVAVSYPTIVTNTNTSFGSSSSSFVCNLPSGITAGDLLILSISGARGDRPFNTPAGWTSLAQPTSGSGSTGHRQLVIYKTADGTETSVTVTTSGGNQNAAASLACRISDWSGTPEANTSSGNNGTSLDGPSLTPSWGAEKTLFLDFTGCSQARNWTASASGWTALTGTAGGSVDNDDSARIECAWLQSDAGSADPGAQTIDNSTTSWTAVTVAIKHA